MQSKLFFWILYASVSLVIAAKYYGYLIPVWVVALLAFIGLIFGTLVFFSNMKSTKKWWDGLFSSRD
jgi:hypothetical protein